MEHGQLLMHDGTYWEVHLHPNQCYLGRSYIKSKRVGLVDFMDTTEEERREFFVIATALRDSLSWLFKPDLFNWATLGNIIRQCHMHCVPRYAAPRELGSMTFTDARWGKNWGPYDEKFRASDDLMLHIYHEVTRAMRDKL